jgi:hypothetical protein
MSEQIPNTIAYKESQAPHSGDTPGGFTEMTGLNMISLGGC